MSSRAKAIEQREQYSRPGGSDAPRDDPDSSAPTTGGEGGTSQGEQVRFGGLTAREASERAVQARRARREREEAERAAAQGTTLASKIERALSSLTQSDVDAMVRTLTGSATGAQTLLRLMDVADGRDAPEAGDGGTLTHEERARILASFSARAAEGQGESDPTSSSTSGGEEGQAGETGEAVVDPA